MRPRDDRGRAPAARPASTLALLKCVRPADHPLVCGLRPAGAHAPRRDGPEVRRPRA